MHISPGDIESMKQGKNRKRRKLSHGRGVARRTYSFSVAEDSSLDVKLRSLDHRSEFIRRSIEDRADMLERMATMLEEIQWLRSDREFDREMCLDLEHRCGVHLRKPSTACAACAAEDAHRGGV